MALKGQAAEDEEELVFSQPRARSQRGLLYSRTWSRSREDLESAVMRLYGLDSKRHHALILPSGMGAIGAVMSSTAANHCGEAWTLVHGDELYCEVARTVRYVVEAHGGKVTTCTVDIRDHERLRSLFAKMGRSIRLFHFEACTNPSGQLFDFALLPELRAFAPQCIFVCDNTWLSGALFNPFELGADLVVESMTKYVSAGRCIGGFVAGASSLVAPVLSWIKAFGIFVAADHCRLFLQGLQTITERMSAISATAEAVARHLETHPAVNRVLYPLLASHPTHALAQRYLTRGGPGCIWFHVSASKKVVMSSLTLETGTGFPECKTSFGAACARVDSWPQPAAADACDWPRSGKQGLPGTWLRLALGHAEPAEETKAAVDALLCHLCPSTGAAKGPLGAAPDARTEAFEKQSSVAGSGHVTVVPQAEPAAPRWRRKA